MKKVFCIILTAILALSMFACAALPVQVQQETEQPIADEPASEPIDEPASEPIEEPVDEPVEEETPAPEEKTGILTADNDPYRLMERWVLTAFQIGEESHKAVDLGSIATYTFGEDGVAVVKAFGESFECNYSVNDREITVVWGFTLGSDSKETVGLYDPETDSFDLHEELNGTAFLYHFERYSTLYGTPEPTAETEPIVTAEPLALSEEAKAIVGTWTYVRLRMSDGSSVSANGYEMKFIFNDDGTASMIATGSQYAGFKWQYSDGKVVLSETGYTYELPYDGTTLEFASGDSTLIFEKAE